MPTPKKGARLGGSPAHQRLILANLATSLFEHGRITTTEAKARTLRPMAEKLITKAKKGDLHNRREVLKTVHDKSVVHTLFTEIAPTFAERPGGYTRITKIGPRKGDNAPMAVIALVTEPYNPRQSKKGAVDTPADVSARVGASKSPVNADALRMEDTLSAEDLTLTEHSRPYKVGKTYGYFQHLRNDEYVHTEHQSNGALSVMWTCADDCFAFLTAVREVAPEFLSGKAEALWWKLDDAGYRIEADTDEDLDFASVSQLLEESDSTRIAFCTLRLSEAELTWQRPFHKARWSQEPHAQAALLSTNRQTGDMAPERLLSLLSATGTSVVQMMAGNWPDKLQDALSVVS